MNSALLILGVLLIVGFFLFSNVMISSEQKQEIQLANKLCNFEYSGIPLGHFGQILTGLFKPEWEVAEKCEQIGTLAKILSMSTYIYIAGFVLVILGLALGGKTKEVIKIIEKPVTISKEIEPEVEKLSVEKTNFCGECGNKLKPDDKFCGKCGAEV